MKNNIKIKIDRLDYKNPINGGFYSLEPLYSIQDITDINEINYITIEGEGFESIINSMPKSYKWKIYTMQFENSIHKQAGIQFNTFFMNKSTCEVNETALKIRNKVIEKLEKLGL